MTHSGPVGCAAARPRIFRKNGHRLFDHHLGIDRKRRDQLTPGTLVHRGEEHDRKLHLADESRQHLCFLARGILEIEQDYIRLRRLELSNGRPRGRRDAGDLYGLGSAETLDQGLSRQRHVINDHHPGLAAGLHERSSLPLRR